MQIDFGEKWVLVAGCSLVVSEHGDEPKLASRVRTGVTGMSFRARMPVPRTYERHDRKRVNYVKRNGLADRAFDSFAELEAHPAGASARRTLGWTSALHGDRVRPRRS